MGRWGTLPGIAPSQGSSSSVRSLRAALGVQDIQYESELNEALRGQVALQDMVLQKRARQSTQGWERPDGGCPVAGGGLCLCLCCIGAR